MAGITSAQLIWHVGCHRKEFEMKKKDKIDWLVFFALILFGFILGMTVCWFVLTIAAAGGMAI